jgi:hypothetical protein
MGMKSKQISTTFVRQFKHLAKLLSVAINRCPDDLWGRPETQTSESPVWLAYHTVAGIAMPHLLSISSFKHPFEIKEGVIVPRSDVQAMLGTIRDHVIHEYTGKTDEMVLKAGKMDSGPGVKNLLYTIRHTQHHIGEFLQILKENGIEPPAWQTVNML